MNVKLRQGQLDECGLTMEDLRVLQSDAHGHPLQRLSQPDQVSVAGQGTRRREHSFQSPESQPSEMWRGSEDVSRRESLVLLCASSALLLTDGVAMNLAIRQAAHDRPDEFGWPSGNELVTTTTRSFREREDDSAGSSTDSLEGLDYVGPVDRARRHADSRDGRTAAPPARFAPWTDASSPPGSASRANPPIVRRWRGAAGLARVGRRLRTPGSARPTRSPPWCHQPRLGLVDIGELCE